MKRPMRYSTTFSSSRRRRGPTLWSSLAQEAPGGLLTSVGSIKITRDCRLKVTSLHLLGKWAGSSPSSKNADNTAKTSSLFNAYNFSIVDQSVRLAPFLHSWYSITSDPWVLSIIATGYAIEFDTLPITGYFKSTITTPFWKMKFRPC